MNYFFSSFQHQWRFFAKATTSDHSSSRSNNLHPLSPSLVIFHKRIEECILFLQTVSANNKRELLILVCGEEFHKYPSINTVGWTKISLNINTTRIHKLSFEKFCKNPFFSPFLFLSLKTKCPFFSFLLQAPDDFVLLSQKQTSFSEEPPLGCPQGQRLNWIPTVWNLARPKGTQWHSNRIFIRLNCPESWALPSPLPPKFI